MLGSTITIDIGTVSDPNEIVIPKVNQDGYSSEYRLRTPDCEYQFLIRHSKESNKLFGQTMERHAVTFRKFDFPTEVLPNGKLTEVYTIIRCTQATTWDELQGMIDGLAGVIAVESTQKAVLNWQS